MKKLIFSLGFLFFASIIYAQDLKSAKADLDKKQLEKAKTDIDAYVAKSPDDAEGQYYKAKIYEQVASSAQFKTLAPDGRDQAFDAFRKAWGDGKDPKITLIAVKDQYAPIFNLYTGYYEEGAAEFNAASPSGDKAGFEKAMNSFIKSNEVGQYIAKNGWSKLPEVDTTLVLNIGKAALNAGKNDSALVYFKKIADAGISGTKGSNDNSAFVLPYQWLTIHYENAKDEPNMVKYDELGKKFFPNDDYFDLVMMDHLRDKKDYDGLFAKYNDLVTKRPDSLGYHFNYANDLFGYIYNGEDGVTVKNKDSLLTVIGVQLEKAHSISADDVTTNWLYSQYYYNQGIDARDAASKLKGPKPDDVKKKADLTAKSKDLFNKAIPYGQKALTSLESNGYKKADKSHYKSIADLMQKIYESLNQNDKVKIYQDKYDSADAKFVN